MPAPNYLPIIVPSIGLMVPFIMRWIENKSRITQARHLLQVIQTRDEITQLLKKSEDFEIELLENEEIQLRYFQKELEKEIRRTSSLEIRPYPFLVSIELIFFISAIFYKAVSFLETLIYAQGDETLPFLEGIFSDPIIRIGLLVFCVVVSIFMTQGLKKGIELRSGTSYKTDFIVFGIFNLVFCCVLLILGTTLFLLDWVMPWF